MSLSLIHISNDVPTTKRIRKALDESGRDIVLSLSNAAPYEHVEELSLIHI